MKLMNQKMKYNLQFFAGNGEGGDGNDNSGNGDGNQDDNQEGDSDNNNDKPDKNSKAKMYTQEEIDDIITERLKRERKKQTKQEQSKDDKPGDKGVVDKSKATDDKIGALEAKLLCFEHDVAKENVSDVVALAKAYMDEDTDFEEAIEKVIKKYPQFVKSSGSKDTEGDGEEETKGSKGSWGQRQQKEQKKTKTLDDEIQEKMFG